MAVRKHFEVSNETLDESHLQSYYDKLIQLPFRIPSLTVPDVVVYMTLLVLEQQPKLNSKQRDEIRVALCQLLSKTWDGSRISRDAIMGVVDRQKVEEGFESRVSMIERLAPRMVGSKRIGGNPRLIKRFMNSLLVRQELARAVNAPAEISEDVLAKILLLQRCGEPALVREIELDVLKSPDGHSQVLGQLERATSTQEIDTAAGDEAVGGAQLSSDISRAWFSDFAKEWVAMEPRLAGIDLRAVFHVSRGSDHLINQSVTLSAASRTLLDVLRSNPQSADQLGTEIAAIPADEVPTVMNALVNLLRTSSSDDFVTRLNCCIAFEKIHDSQSSLLISTLLSVAPDKFQTASIIPIRDRPWARQIQRDLQGKLPEKSPVLKAFAQARSK